LPEPRINKLIAWLLLAIVAFAPLPFGSEPRWAWSLIAVATGLGLLGWSACAVVRRRGVPLPHDMRRLAPVGILFAVVLLWIAVQASPWSPAALHAPVWGVAESLLNRPLAGAISINPTETIGGLVRLASYGGVFFLAALVAASADRALWLLRGIVAVGVVYAGYGLVNELLGLNKVLWLTKWRDLGDVSSTLLDRNAYATYAGLGLTGALALLFRPKFRDGDLDGGWRSSIRVCADYFFTRSWPSMAAVAILFAAVVLTHSRSGAAAAMLSVAVFVLFATRRWQNRKPAYFVGLAICLAGGIILAIGGTGTAEHMGRVGAAAAERSEVYRLTAGTIAEAPLPGTGHRTFAEAFAAHRSETLQAPFLHGHNMYLETALELGVAGAAALFAIVAWLALLCLRASGRPGRNATLPCLGLAATALVASHSLTDSTLRIPAVAILFAALMGIACARGRTLRPAASAPPRDIRNGIQPG
jgi:O-antigen ligase